eukprot:jgi/Ulvmu1/12084/UM084_0007.1
MALLATAAMTPVGGSRVPVPGRVCKPDCCKNGFDCCNSQCVRNDAFPRPGPICARPGDCCSNPKNECADLPPPPTPHDDPNDDSECCAAGEECCNGGCVAKLDDEDPSGVQRICLGRRGCCPLPPSNGECKKDCCPPGLDCICGTCQVFLGFPVLCAEDSGTCCGDPENPCATDV